MKRPSQLIALLAAGLVVGCGGQVGSPQGQDHTTSLAPAPGGPIARPPGIPTRPAESASQLLCDLIDNLPGGNIGGVNINKPWCTHTEFDNLYYLGSKDPYWSYVGGPPTSDRAIAMSDAIYCALRDSDGALADGTVHTGVGRFGMESRIFVSKKDPGARQIVGQRLGRLYAFGVGLDLEDQDFTATLPSEYGGPAWVWGEPSGYYFDLATSTSSWDLSGSGTLGLFTLSLDFGQNGFFQSMNNNGIAFSPRTSTNGPNPAFSWATMQSQCDVCLQGGGWFCPCPSAADITAHNNFASWTDDQYRNLRDGVLPYDAALGGVSGNYVYRDSTKNWTQLGFANGGTTPDDPTHTDGRSPSTHFNFTFALDYDIIDLSLTLGVGFRSGMELTQGSHYVYEFKYHYADVGTSLDAESRAALDARLVIRNPFPFGPDNLVDETFNIFNAPNTAHVDAAQMSYDYQNGFPFSTYASATGGVAQSAPAAHDACLAAPAVSSPPVPPGDPQSFVQQVTDAAKQQLFPCHIRLCRPYAQGSYVGTLELCEWNRQTQKLDCQQTTQSCATCDQSAELCDASGNVYSPSSSIREIQCQIK